MRLSGPEEGDFDLGWARCDDQYYRHNKIVRAGRDARDFHWAAIQHCCREATDGLIEREFMARILVESMAEQSLEWILDRCVKHRLLDVRNGQYWVHDFLDYNPSAAEEAARLEEIRRKRSEAGRKGMAARWGKSDGNEDNKDNTGGNNGYNKTAICYNKKITPSPESQSPESPNPESPLDCVADAPPQPPKRSHPTRFEKPSVDELRTYMDTLEPPIGHKAERFIDYHDANGWRVGNGAGKPMKSWKATARLWARNEATYEEERAARKRANNRPGTPPKTLAESAADMEAKLKELGHKIK